MLVAYPIRLNEHILVQQSLSVRSECSDQGLAESRPETCGDPQSERRRLCSCCVWLFSPAVAHEHPDQSAVQTTPGLPERPSLWPAQTADCARRERRMPCSRFRTGCWSGRHPLAFHSTHIAIELRSRRLIIVRTLVLDVLPLSKC